MRACVDAGHGGADCGAIANYRGGHDESVINLMYASVLAGHLAGFGWNVDMTRYTDEFLTLEERCEIANDNKADCFISIHCNAYKTCNPRGWEIWKYPHVTRDMMPSDRLASNVAEYMESVDLPSRGIKAKKFYVLANTDMPAILIELGFMSNRDDLFYLLDPRHVVGYCNKIALGVASWRP
jgi:N-acetylmuramoyl-L-alanine amidase